MPLTFMFILHLTVFFRLYLFIFGCAGSLLLHGLGFSLVAENRSYSIVAPLSSGTWASHCGGFSRCGAWAPRHVGSVVVTPGCRAQTQ